ncbi:hypothetical protein GCM10007301_44350 [Azorhizobium oxalatiphilum]|uniref:Uncharacterized protein n=1 Tax=Azorhizobium oxalatiphilum TaxID=980631 RepID=A0A917CCU5_9HYPH|nr:hypothetical protein [Azorhizobium oxalatiphilum]GGF79445.1 hypothetical protein GCM10007301_44350 [Azorhizobium oxalatiphilum]
MLLIDLIKALFPDGYLSFETDMVAAKGPIEGTDFRGPPYLCTDLFAIAASALQRSGAYHHVCSDSLPPSLRTITVDDMDRAHWRTAGEAWRAQEPPPPAVLTIWADFWSLRDADLFVTLAPVASEPAWWRLALSLMCIADEAAQGLGFKRSASQLSLLADLIERLFMSKIGHTKQPFSCSEANPDLVCVLPKSRTPSVGATLRSLSHNLALLPPRGLARAYWLPYTAPSRHDRTQDDKSLNCLLVPMPFRIQAQSIVGEPGQNGDTGAFHVDPVWCERSRPPHGPDSNDGFALFWSFIKALIDEAETDVGEVHALVFPELSLSASVFRKLADRLKETHVEILIAGLFDWVGDTDTEVTDGNYAALAVIGDDGLITHRQKHHRWRLDRQQIQSYSLGSALDPCISWWEDISITSRSLDVYVLRGTTTVTTLICEDLARHDPCQELVRGIGPNIVFALLMDGAQLKERWPARYATVLAEDPGSSVLSFTSLGLVERTNDTGRYAPSRSIGLWRDDRGETTELSLPRDSQALCISLRSTPFEEHTLDGRGDEKTSESWRLVGAQPVKIDTRNDSAQQMLAGKWPKRRSR